MINITEKQSDDIIAYITPKNIIEDTHRQSLKDSIETFDFEVFAEYDYAEFLGKNNRVVIPAEDEGYREFIIEEVVLHHDDEVVVAEVYSIASFLQLKKAKPLEPQSFTANTPSQLVGRTLNGTEWSPGIIEATGIRTMHIEQYTNPYAFLKRIATEFDVELRFRTETNGRRVTGRYVDLIQRHGEWRGRTIEFGKDLIGIERTERTDNVYTALIGLGPERDDGTRLEIIVEDEEALQRWGRPDPITGELQHLWDTYEPESSDQNMTEERLFALVENELEKRVNEIVEYDTTIADLEHVPGLANKKIRFGDTIRIKDTKFNPPLYLEARIFEQERSITEKGQKKVKLGDFVEYTEEEVTSIWQQLIEDIRKRMERTVIANIVTSAGTVFKNGEGSTTLEAKTFISGYETDIDGTKYEYRWHKFDKDGHFLPGFSETGKSVTIEASTIDESAAYTVEVILHGDVVTLSQITLTNVFDGTDGEDGEQGPQGPKGEDGEDGYTPIKGVDYFDGEPGQDGRSSYLWVRYSQNANGNPMTPDPTNAKYIGVATTESPSAPTSYTDYEWSLIKGTDGIPGEDGDDGRTSYLHIKYSNDGGQTFTGNNGEDVGEWIGTYVDFVQADSNNVNDYTWNKVKGEKGDKGDQGVPGVEGPPGQDGQSLYTWVKYATNADGANMSDLPVGRSYIGLAYNKPTPVESTNPSDYQWAKIEGDQGVEGEDGQTYYTWLKYADTPTSGMSDSPTGKTYMGLAYNKTTPVESTNYSDYQWSLIKGDKGEKGDRGAKGDKGDDGVGVTNAAISYQLHTNGSTPPTGNWSSTVPSPIKGRYLWTRTITTYSDDSDVTTYSVSYIATDGQKGDDGKGISSTTIRYQISTSGTSIPSGTWSSSVPNPVKGRYLWTRTVITYTDGTSSTSYSTSYYATDGQKGDKGDTGDRGPQGPRGIQGPKGDDGQSQYVHIRYSANSNGNPMTTTPQSNSKYIGIANTTSSSAPGSYSSYTWALMRGADGTDGARGVPGPKGDDGETTYTWVKYADDENGNGMSDSPIDKLYIGLAFNKTTPDESTNRNDYTWSLMPQNIEIGGRNLIPNSNEFSKFTGYNGASRSITTDVSVSEWGATDATRLVFTGGGSILKTTPQIYANPGSTVTYSFWAKNNGSKDISFRFNGLNGAPTITLNPNESRRVVVSGTMRGNYNWFQHQIRSVDEGDTINITLWRSQLEYSNGKATDWTPAPEDVQAEIDEAKQQAQNAQTSADGKNTVFRQSSTPPTSNRKIGDIWFNTGQGNRMSVWTGSWTLTRLDYQALNVGKLSAISADLGNITAGHISGVTGTFSGTLATDEDISVGRLVEVLWSNTADSGILFKTTYDSEAATIKMNRQGNLVIENSNGHIDMPSTIRVGGIQLGTSGHVVDSIADQGSNSNGHYIRYANGIQICWHEIGSRSVSTSTSTFQGTTYYRAHLTWAFPISFNSAPSVQFQSAVGGNPLAPYLSRVYNKDTASVTTQTLSVTSFSSVTDLSFFAIGRWR